MIPAALEGQELASLAAEAQYYGLAALHESLQTASLQPSTGKSCATYEYKHILDDYIHFRRDTESQLQTLYDAGWEPMQSCIGGASSGGNMRFPLFLVLRRLR